MTRRHGVFGGPNKSDAVSLDGRIDGGQPLFATPSAGDFLQQARPSRYPAIATRITPSKKARFSALSASKGMTESALLSLLIDHVLSQNPVEASEADATDFNFASERMSLRLRPGDRELLDARAAARGMKPAGYAVMLLRAHVRGTAPLPIVELNTLKAAVAELSSIGRTLSQAAKAGNGGQVLDTPPREVLEALQGRVVEVRQYVAALARESLMSWETD